jgi:hypothetical protein
VISNLPCNSDATLVTVSIGAKCRKILAAVTAPLDSLSQRRINDATMCSSYTLVCAIHAQQTLIALSIKPRRSLEAKNPFLRRQLALYKERGIKPRHVDAATRMSLVLLSKLFDWRCALIIVRPETLIRWHRAGVSRGFHRFLLASR